jgi:hypothetical protein
MKHIHAVVYGVLFCLPSALFWAFMSFGSGGSVGGILALVLGLVATAIGVPWNGILFIAWNLLAQALDYPGWLGYQNSDWFFIFAIILAPTPGAFINGAIVGVQAEKRESSRGA